MAIAVAGTVKCGLSGAGDTCQTSSWSPADGDLLLGAVVMRDVSIPPQVSGNGQAWSLIDSAYNNGSDTIVHTFYLVASSPSSGAITVDVTGNSGAVSATFVRLTGCHASTPIETTNTANSGGSNDDMLISVTTSTANALAVALGSHTNTTFSMPGGETEISNNSAYGSGASEARCSVWSQSVASPTTVDVGAANDLSASCDWALIGYSIKPASSPQTLTPSALAVAATPAAPSVSLGAVTVSTSPVTPSPSIPEATVSLGALALTPGAVSVAVTIPDATVVQSGNLAPAALAVAVGIPDATVAAGAITVSPAALQVTSTQPAATVSAGPVVLAPAALTPTLVVPGGSMLPLVFAVLATTLNKVSVATAEHWVVADTALAGSRSEHESTGTEVAVLSMVEVLVSEHEHEVEV